MDMLPLLCIVSVAFTGLTKGAGVLPDVLNAAVGETVMFTTTMPPAENPFLTVGWKFGDRDIITFNVANITAPEYEGRITLFMSTASLELRDVSLNDSGEYRVIILPVGEQFKDGSTRLGVYVPVSNVEVTTSSTDLVEFSSSVLLSCTSSGSSGSSLSFLWLNGSSEVTASDRVQLTDGGSTLTILNVTRYDQGPFMCRASNPVSHGISEPVNFSISFGPENTISTLSPSREYFEEGSNVTLSCSADSRPAALFQWFLNGDLPSGTGPELRLMNIQMNQSGNYSCQASNSKTLRSETSAPSVVTVLASVANIVVSSNTKDLVEFSSNSVSLSCSSSGSSLSFLWLNGSSEVTASDRVQLTDGGSNLTIVNVTRYDQGPFVCRVSNPVSHGTSNSINLSISYGPENIILTLSPSQEYYEQGSDIRLYCSADSRPSALFYWFLNGDLQSDTGAEISLMNIQMNQSGKHSCQAFNSKTLRYEISQQSVISVLERISDASVTSSTNMVMEGNSVNLTCDAAGSVFTRKWMKDGSDLVLDDNMMLHDENRVLSLNNLTKNHRGEYSCEIRNPINIEEAKYTLIVNYGPENVRITGPSEIEEKKTLTLNCTADSTPSANYTWILNGTEIHNSAVLTKDVTDSSDNGNYICEAKNNITGRTSSAVHQLSVTAHETSSCSAGCIAGIVIACVVLCGAVGCGGYYIYKKKKQPKISSNRTRGEGQDNAAYSNSQELNYADIMFKNKNGTTVQLGSQNKPSEYAQIRVDSSHPAASSPPTYNAHMQRTKRQAPEAPC